MTSISPRVVILGGNGFTGSALRRAFTAEHGCAKVTPLASSDFDLLGDDAPVRLAGWLDDKTILVVTARSRAGEPFAQFDGEVRMAANVARSLALKRVRKCVYFSTLSVYDDTRTDLAITENTPVAPASFYGLGKHTAESLLRLTADRHGVPLLVFRPCKIYGPGDPSGAYGPASFVQAALAGGPMAIYGDGRELRDHLFIDDLARAVVPLALSEAEGVYNLASGESHSFAELLDIVRRIVARDFLVVRQARTRPLIDQMIEMDKLRAALPGWRPTPLAEGVRLLYQALVAA